METMIVNALYSERLRFPISKFNMNHLETRLQPLSHTPRSRIAHVKEIATFVSTTEGSFLLAARVIALLLWFVHCLSIELDFGKYPSFYH